MGLPYLRFRSYGSVAVILAIFLIASCITPTLAQNDSQLESSKPLCSLESDDDIFHNFFLPKWVARGRCVRSQKGSRCDQILLDLLKNLNKLREAEYAGAASVLSLLPTIGALLGPPTSEIWRLKSIVPFGGVLAMTLSFGGAILPIRVEDYEILSKRNTAIGSVMNLQKILSGSHGGEQPIEEKLQMLGDKVRERLDQRESVRLPRIPLFCGLFGMVLLMFMAQGAMAVVENGGVINWWCANRVWMHFWYFFGKALPQTL